jgi:hypothetical protein
MVVTSWLRGHLQRGITYFSVGMACALLVNVFVYDFGRFGVEVSRLFSPDFTLAYASSGLSSGLALGLAYPLSFVIKPLEFLRICFSEPARWGLTAVMLGAGIASYREGHAWRLTLALLLSFLACITPYIIRLFLTPATVNYHITYALSGRVFYLPFVIVALAWGRLVSRLYGWIGDRRGARLLWLVPVAAYGYALWYYDRTDFLGLDVARGVLQGAPPRWNPFANPQPVWMILVGLAVITALILRRQAVRGRSGNVVT